MNESVSSMQEIIMSLFFVLGLIFMLAWLLKKTPAFSVKGDQKLRIVQSLAVGNKERMVLLDMDGEKILLGVTSHHISTLWKNNKSLTLQAESTNDKETDFSKHLSDLMIKEVAC